jgi:hypothetical protein
VPALALLWWALAVSAGLPAILDRNSVTGQMGPPLPVILGDLGVADVMLGTARSAWRLLLAFSWEVFWPAAVFAALVIAGRYLWGSGKLRTLREENA